MSRLRRASSDRGAPQRSHVDAVHACSPLRSCDRDGAMEGDACPMAVGHSEVAETVAAQLIATILQASDDLDPVAIGTSLGVAKRQLSLAGCADRVLSPAVRELNRFRAAGTRNEQQNLMATEAVLAWLHGQTCLVPKPREIEPVLLACGPHDVQTVGVELLALLLRTARRPCRVLGARTSTAPWRWRPGPPERQPWWSSPNCRAVVRRPLPRCVPLTQLACRCSSPARHLTRRRAGSWYQVPTWESGQHPPACCSSGRWAARNGGRYPLARSAGRAQQRTCSGVAMPAESSGAGCGVPATEVIGSTPAQ